MFKIRNMSLKKIFIVVNSFGKGGAEMSLAILAGELANKGYTVFYISLWDENNKYNFDWLRAKNVNIVTLATRQQNVFECVANFYRLLRLHKPIFIYSAMLKADLIARILAFLVNIPSASSIRNNPIKFYQKNKFKLWIFFSLQFIQKNVVFLSNKAKVDFQNSQQASMCRANIYTLHNPIEVDRIFSELMLRNKLELFVLKCRKFVEDKKPTFKLALVSRLVPEKGILILLENIKNELIKYNFCLLIYGDGPLKLEILNFIFYHNLQNNVVLKGFVNNKIEIYRDSDIIIFPSESEGFGRVPFESILYGNMVFCNNKVSIIDEFLPIPLLWQDFEYPISLADFIKNAVNLNVEDTIERIKKLSLALSPQTHSDNFIEIMNECVNN